jgi:hypothetical protein
MATASENTSLFLKKAQQRFAENQYTWKADFPPFNFPVIGVARRSKFELTKFGFADYCFVFGLAPELNADSLRAFSAKSFELSLKLKTNPLPRGLFASVWCYPVLITENVSESMIQTISNEPPTKHWSAAEIPVIFDSAKNQLHYFQKTPLWGAAYYAGFRSMIQKFLG